MENNLQARNDKVSKSVVIFRLCLLTYLLGTLSSVLKDGKKEVK